MDEVDTILATGAVAVTSGLIGALVPAVAMLFGEWRARAAARREVVADLAGELLDLCERYRASNGDLMFSEQLMLQLAGTGYTKRSDWQRNRDDVRAQMRALQVRIGARHKKLGAAAGALIEASIDPKSKWSTARDGFTEAMAR